MYEREWLLAAAAAAAGTKYSHDCQYDAITVVELVNFDGSIQ